jgi:hypothetical protein
MSGATLNYTHAGPRRIRDLPWRRSLLAVLALYLAGYTWCRADGSIVHTFGVVPGLKVTGPGYADHIWTANNDGLAQLFVPAIAIETAVRDLGR